MALEAKNRGNAAFTAGNFELAVTEFTNAIGLDPTNHVLYRYLHIFLARGFDVFLVFIYLILVQLVMLLIL